MRTDLTGDPTTARNGQRVYHNCGQPVTRWSDGAILPALCPHCKRQIWRRDIPLLKAVAP